MTNQAAKLLSAVVIGSLAAVSLVAGPSGAAKAADDCLAAPKSRAPQGAHWYYRIDRTTKRQCWYVRDESRGSQPASASPAQPATSQASATLQKSVADAHAELPAVSEPVEQAVISQPAVAGAANLGRAAGDSRLSNADGWTLASRWSSNPDTYGAGAPSQPADVADVKQRLQAAATKPAAEVEDGSVWTLVAAFAGALTLAGIATTAIIRLARNRSIDYDASLERPHAIWSTDAGEESPVAPSGDEPVMNWVRIVRETQQARDHGREIEQLLARVPRHPLA